VKIACSFVRNFILYESSQSNKKVVGIILNLEGNKVASLSLNEKELLCFLILCLKSDHLPFFSGQNVQSLAYNNVETRAG
jgi:hypothetical protein